MSLRTAWSLGERTVPAVARALRRVHLATVAAPRLQSVPEACRAVVVAVVARAGTRSDHQLLGSAKVGVLERRLALDVVGHALVPLARVQVDHLVLR